MNTQYSQLQNLTKNLSILYVEDDIDFAENTLKVFKNFFNDIDIAHNGRDGLEKYLKSLNKDKKVYDIVISDIEMPYMNGIDLIKAIYKQNPHQIVIVISAYNNPEYLIEFINIGIKHFLLKPFELENILEVFNKIIQYIKNLEEDNSFILDKGLYYNFDRLELIYFKKIIKLTKKEILLLELLIQNRSRTIPYSEIYHSLWPDKIETISDKILNPIIFRFKKKIPIPIIKSVYGIGYKLVIE